MRDYVVFTTGPNLDRLKKYFKTEGIALINVTKHSELSFSLHIRVDRERPGDDAYKRDKRLRHDVMDAAGTSLVSVAPLYEWEFIFRKNGGKAQ